MLIETVKFTLHVVHFQVRCCVTSETIFRTERSDPFCATSILKIIVTVLDGACLHSTLLL